MSTESSNPNRDFSGELSTEHINAIAQEIFKISEDKDLLWDMLPLKNTEGRFEISLSDEAGNGHDYWSFDSEEITNKIIDRLSEILEQKQ